MCVGFARLWHVPNARVDSEENLFKKAKGRLYYFYVNRVLMLVFQSTVSLVAYLSTLRICVSKMSTVLFENYFVPTLWLATLVFAVGRGIGGLGNEAKRNAKTDQLRPVPRDKCK